MQVILFRVPWLNYTDNIDITVHPLQNDMFYWKHQLFDQETDDKFWYQGRTQVGTAGLDPPTQIEINKEQNLHA
jgi:hypothetical protein